MSDESDQQAIDALLDFWFDDETKKRWYQSTDAFDDHCRTRFGKLLALAASGSLTAWEATAEGALALCLLLDQIPRNICRGTAAAFENDPKAVAAAERAIEKGFDRKLDIERRKFLYMPFMHSEVLAEQERSVALARSIDDNKDMIDYAVEHADIIRRFGRFPHRNAILGRSDTPEEKAFLADGAKTYGQSTKEDG